ncbi:MAG: hypothetical protein U0V75_08755 [Ferruginibacter sp.]
MCKIIMVAACLIYLPASAQLTVAAIDSICHSTDTLTQKNCLMACGHSGGTENCYLRQNEDVLLFCSGNFLLRDTVFGYQYYYSAHRPIKVTLRFEARKTGKVYQAVYYFSNNTAISIRGEDASISDKETALSYGMNHTRWFPKRRPEFL